MLLSNVTAILFKLLLAGTMLGIHLASASAAPVPKPQNSKWVDRLPDGNGKSIIVKKCQSCHGLESVVVSRRSKDEWNDVLGLMIAAGVSLTPDETRVLVDYLAANFGSAGSATPASAISAQMSQTSRLNLIEDPGKARFSEIPDSLGFPKGLEMSVVSGDPSKAGLFVVLFKMPAGQIIRTDQFPEEENIVCLRGGLQVGEGTTFDGSKSQSLNPGAVMHLPALSNHVVRASEPTIILVFGNGPLLTSKTSASAKK